MYLDHWFPLLSSWAHYQEPKKETTSSMCWLKHEEHHKTINLKQRPICHDGTNWTSIQCGDPGMAFWKFLFHSIMFWFFWHWLDQKLVSFAQYSLLKIQLVTLFRPRISEWPNATQKACLILCWLNCLLLVTLSGISSTTENIRFNAGKQIPPYHQGWLSQVMLPAWVWFQNSWQEVHCWAKGFFCKITGPQVSQWFVWVTYLGDFFFEFLTFESAFPWLRTSTNLLTHPVYNQASYTGNMGTFLGLFATLKIKIFVAMTWITCKPVLTAVEFSSIACSHNKSVRTVNLEAESEWMWTEIEHKADSSVLTIVFE